MDTSSQQAAVAAAKTFNNYKRTKETSENQT